MVTVDQGRWDIVGSELLVPESIQDKIRHECSSDDEKMSTLSNYVATILPDITWEKIASVLYRHGHNRAVELVKPYLHIVPG